MNSHTEISGDNRGIIAGRDIKDTNLINVGDVSGSYNAIGVGAQIVVHEVQAISPVDERRKAMRLNQAILADAIEAKVGDYTRQLAKNLTDVRRNPYKDLPAYQLVDAPYFYGRADAVRELLDHIHQSPLTVLHAASGAGKSSLVQAGLMSRLLAAGHLPLYIRTRAHRIGATRQAGLTSAIKAAFLPGIITDPTLAELNVSPLRSFLTDVSRNLRRSTLYIFLDQFEDFFNDALMHPMLRVPFVEELHQCLDDPGLNVRWVLSLRKEYYSDLYIFGDTVFYNQVHLPGLDATEARQVIVKPSQQRNVIYEEGLVHKILQDLRPQQEESDPTVSTKADDAVDVLRFAPTQIQLVCHALFEELGDEDNIITFSLYDRRRGRRSLPGAEGILTGHLQNVLEKRLPKEDRALAGLILEELVTSQTRRIPRRLDELIAQLRRRQASVDEERVRRILDTLVNNRLLETDEDATTYELTHDYLLREIELDPTSRTRKAAQEILDQELENYINRGWLLGVEKFSLIDSQRNYLVIDENAANLLRESGAAIEKEKNAQKRRTRILTTFMTLLVIFLIPTLFIAANTWMFYRRQNSVWQPTGFPSDSVWSIVQNNDDSNPGSQFVCVASADIGVGCSSNLTNWNIYQMGFPLDAPAWLNNRNSLLGSLTRRSWSTTIDMVEAMAVDPSNPQRMIASMMDSQDFYFSDNGGVSWQVINMPNSSTAPIYIRKMFLYGHTVIALGYTQAAVESGSIQEGALYISNDLASNWNIVGGPQLKTGIIEDFIIISRMRNSIESILAVGESGILVGTAASEWEWEEQLSFPDGESGALVAMSDDTLFVTTFSSKDRITSLYKWNINSMVSQEPLLRYGGVPKAMVVNPLHESDDILWILLQSGRSLSVRQNGVHNVIERYPEWIPANMSIIYPSGANNLVVFTDQSGGNHLLLAHRDGLFEFCGDEFPSVICTQN